MITRRTLLGGAAAAAAASLAGCAPATKFKSYHGPQVTQVLAMKERRQLFLYSGSRILKVYGFDLGGNPVGPKVMEGDGRTPEGAYLIDRRNPNSSYHLSIGVSYPNEADVARAEAMGVRPGGDIFIHGTPREMRRAQDWTAGCLAVRDREMEDIYAMVPDGTPITIVA